MPYHLSVFLENKPGRLEKLTGTLAAAGISLRAVSVASAGEFGVVKLLVNDAERAAAGLKAAGFTVKLRPILIVLVADKPGGFHELLAALSANGINIEDCYGFVLEDKKRAAIVVETEDGERARAVLPEAGFVVVDERTPGNF
jgi:hypothetical protein